jgi:hypothetical protein
MDTYAKKIHLAYSFTNPEEQYGGSLSTYNHERFLNDCTSAILDHINSGTNEISVETLDLNEDSGDEASEAGSSSLGSEAGGEDHCVSPDTNEATTEAPIETTTDAIVDPLPTDTENEIEGGDAQDSEPQGPELMADVPSPPSGDDDYPVNDEPAHSEPSDDPPDEVPRNDPVSDQSQSDDDVADTDVAEAEVAIEDAVDAVEKEIQSLEKNIDDHMDRIDKEVDQKVEREIASHDEKIDRRLNGNSERTEVEREISPPKDEDKRSSSILSYIRRKN